MSHIQFYKYATFALLALNIVLATFLIIGAPKHDRPKPLGKGGAMKMLHLSEQQHQLFIQSANNHGETMGKLDGMQRDLLRNYFEQILESTPIKSDSILMEVQEIEEKKITYTYQHLAEVKALLNEGQLPYFQDFITHILIVLLETDKKKPPTPKDF